MMPLSLLAGRTVHVGLNFCNNFNSLFFSCDFKIGGGGGGGMEWGDFLR